MIVKRVALLTLVYLCTTLVYAYAQLVREDILYIKPNAQDYLLYTTTRSNFGTFSKILPKSTNITKKYLYINPEKYTVGENSRYKRIVFPTGNFALISEERFTDKELKVNKEGIFTFRFDSIPRLGGRHYGLSTTVRYYKQLTYVWVLPEDYEFVDYSCNKPGQWVKKGNTLAYFGYKVNDVLPKIRFRPVLQVTLGNVKSLLYEVNSKGMAVTSNSKGVQINFRRGVLFTKGTTAISSLGQNILVRLAKTLKSSVKVRLAIAVPVRNGIDAGRWMLAAARGRTMVEQLINRGIDPARIEVNTFGVKTSQSKKGIEIQLINAPKRKQ
ncbi:hypothetical protein [uncultured Microscilla sp.]|uniref:OmpA/MotB family protein n=1 Tax=uncultured Microscilla sp. TaxID=432653 RepID=UPI00260F8F31|nr:hypothetical protein [uncultured Microscilla sp.]